MWHPQENNSTQETSVSDAGATLAEALVSGVDSYVCFPRRFADDVLIGRLSVDEYLMLAWLFPRANYLRGVATINYALIAEELQGRYQKNQINKIFLSLKEKKCVFFEVQQGRRGTFPVLLDNFYRPNKTRIDLRGKPASRSVVETADEVPAEGATEVLAHEQKSFKEYFPVKPVFLDEFNDVFGRSTNNENENREYIKPTSFALKEKTENLAQYESENEHDEQRIRRIATELGETDLRFIHSAYEKYGIQPIEDAYRQTVEKHNQGGVENIRKYFNFLVRKFGEDGRSKSL